MTEYYSVNLDPDQEALELFPELGIPLGTDIDHIDLIKRAQAACNTIYEMDIDVDGSPDEPTVAALVHSYADDPEATSKKMTNRRASSLAPATWHEIDAILDEFGQHVVHDAISIRNLIVNKLVLKSDHPDPRISLRAIELLGKLSDVAAFTERMQVNHNEKPVNDLREELKNKLHRMIGADEAVEDAEVVSDD